MWWRGRNGANLGMVPPWGRGSSSRGRTHGRNVLRSGSGGGRSRHGDDGSEAKVGAADRGRRRLPHSRPEAVSSARLHHSWAREGEEMERMGGGGFSEMILE